MLTRLQEAKLIQTARSARKNAYSPYSKIRVGAALLVRGGKIFTGANIENASYGLTICAERTAVVQAVLSGKSEFIAIALSSNLQEIITPCGACRQVLAEFATNMTIICENRSGKCLVFTLAQLLPNSFAIRV